MVSFQIQGATTNRLVDELYNLPPVTEGEVQKFCHRCMARICLGISFRHLYSRSVPKLSLQSLLGWRTSPFWKELSLSRQQRCRHFLRRLDWTQVIHRMIGQYPTQHDLEHLLLAGLIPHVSTNLHRLQSANRRHHSTETALHKISNDFLEAAYAEKVTVLATLNLSAAFDTIDHLVLHHCL